MSDSLFGLYQAIAARSPDFVVGWRGEEKILRDTFLHRVHAWNALLSRVNGQNFALYLEDSIEFGAALLGCWHAGKTVWLTADRLDASCRAMSCRVDGFLGEFPAKWQPLSPCEGDVENAGEQTILSPDFPALVVHTSGTTGAAQAIPKRLAQLANEVAMLESLFGARMRDAAIIATVSHHHIYGLLFKVLWPLLAGRSVHARLHSVPEELLYAMTRQPCVLIASPAYLKRMPDHLAWRENVSLRAIFSSGGPLPAETSLTITGLLGVAPIEIYGSSETGGIAWRQRCGDGDDGWTPFPNLQWRIEAAEGLLEVRSPHLADMDWYRLSDRAQIQTDRFLLQGRSDRIVKIEEKRISLDAIESGLMRSSLVSEVRVLPCDDAPERRQKLAAFVVLSDRGQALLKASGKRAVNMQLQDHLVDAIDPVAWPRRWRYFDCMPTDSQGKTTFSMLMASLNEKPDRPDWQLLKQDAVQVELQAIIDPALSCFEGHFPDAPILPGVVQLDWAIEKGRRYFDLPPCFRGVRMLKFQKVIQPGNKVTLELVHDRQKDSLNFRYFAEQEQYASGRILFAAEGASSDI
ncbi:AMP-binding protein [Oxalicibacterium solurbis]|uniref:AMP-binding protein n=1 Tax=Oxalicibacterium solurbis TaxID=69280 RepID=A0A8J3B3G8_9BURK|nr:AMP-binding protein [Oxalicibacterium solurbis]GGI54285.1 AMP-binding protein [Oxalicibacterium solurbis]